MDLTPSQQVELRRRLDIIEQLLMSSDHEVNGALVDVLSALRGPDSSQDDAKQATIVVRRNAFPKLCEILMSSYSNPTIQYRWEVGLSKLAINPSWKNVNKVLDTETTHFQLHIQSAFKALGLGSE